MLKKILCFILPLLLLHPFTALAGEYSVSAYSAVVIDSTTNSILFEKNAYDCLPMASTTKIMTCLIACESGKINDVVTITDKMVDTEGSSIYLEVGDKITLLDLIRGAMIASGNDAANSIAIYLAKTTDAFVSLMNEKASELGMKSTAFETPSGLDKGRHHSTAYDMALLASAAMKNELFSQICSMKSAEITVNSKKQTIYNHNKLLSKSDNFTGVKTGFTQKAGRCLVSSYKYKNNTIICVTLNAPNDWQDHTSLINAAKKKYKTNEQTVSLSIDVVGAQRDNICCNAHFKVSSLGDVQYKAYYYPFLYAPVNKGDIVGRLDIFSDSIKITTVDITAGEGISIYGKQ